MHSQVARDKAMFMLEVYAVSTARFVYVAPGLYTSSFSWEAYSGDFKASHLQAIKALISSSLCVCIILI